ncbi:glycosyltransferase family 2 protein [uncultured Draconibacterium sp.]|uniref:glycosyltransferase family 2 protein n=1 Tax=uncultured Draconibacterium sp. TaxID=1573823 RepID=UPI00321702E6
MNTSIIVCTYNEEETIFGVVAACCKHNPDAEIIVVDDASTDSTEEVLSSLAMHYEFEYLKLDKNRGKSYAMAHGVEYATNEVILFFNANVKDIREHHFSNMLNPIFQGKADLVLGLPSAYTVDFRINPYKSVVGQKAMLKEDLLPILDDIRELRFGVESYITLYYQTIGKRMHFVSLDGLQTLLDKTFDEQLNDDAEGSLEVANALLTNIDLITKRVQNNIQKTQNYTRSTISSVQLELNKRMKMLKERNGEIELA